MYVCVCRHIHIYTQKEGLKTAIMLLVATFAWFNFRLFKSCSLCFPGVSKLNITNSAFVIKIKFYLEREKCTTD